MSVIKQLTQPINTIATHFSRCVILCLALLLLIGCSNTLTSRQAEIAERGAEVMPFDLDTTEHIFTPREDGGLQQVIAHDTDDSEQIALIREHLSEEANHFREGNFDDPAQIHGHSMPGLKELQEHNGQIEIVYSELPDGAQIEYVTNEPELIEALHHWFEAQVSDHGEHDSMGD